MILRLWLAAQDLPQVFKTMWEIYWEVAFSRVTRIFALTIMLCMIGCALVFPGAFQFLSGWMLVNDPQQYLSVLIPLIVITWVSMYLVLAWEAIYRRARALKHL